MTARADVVAEAARKQIFARQLKASVKAPPELASEVDRLLEADCLQSLSMVNKAGLAVAGFNKVGAALEKGEAAAILEAADGGADGKRKIAQAVRRGLGPVETIALFTSSQLDLALGRTNVIHAALARGGPTNAFLARCRRVAAYRGENASDAANIDERDDFDVAGGASSANDFERTGADPESDN